MASNTTTSSSARSSRQEELKKLLPQLEARYRARCGRELYELCESEQKGIYMVANQVILSGDIVFIEKPLHSQPKRYSPEFLQRPDVQPLWALISRLSLQHEDPPPRALEALQRVADLHAMEQMVTSPKIQEIWGLCDAHRQGAHVGDLVVIADLQSVAGKAMNGKRGRVVSEDTSSNSQGGDPGRLGVSIQTNNHTTTKKSIACANLKTLGGILRTNAFGSDEDSTMLVLYKTLSRINHACGDAANVFKYETNGQAYLIAKKEIQAGDEILINYLAPQDNLREELQRRYNFVCTCPHHDS